MGRALTISALALTAAALTVPGVAHAEERVCRGSIGATTLDNVRVPTGATCTLRGTTVTGTLKVEAAPPSTPATCGSSATSRPKGTSTWCSTRRASAGASSSCRVGPPPSPATA